MRVLGVAIWVLLLGAMSAPLRGAADSTPRQIITRDASGPVIVWDATPQIEGFIAHNTAMSAGLTQLKLRALDLFVQAAGTFARNERHLSVMVVYARSGAINARYQTKSFQGVGDVLTLGGSPRTHLNPAWRTQAKAGRFPRGITIQVSSPLSELTPSR